jgi:hypothetical protein
MPKLPQLRPQHPVGVGALRLTLVCFFLLIIFFLTDPSLEVLAASWGSWLRAGETLISFFSFFIHPRHGPSPGEQLQLAVAVVKG